MTTAVAGPLLERAYPIATLLALLGGAACGRTANDEPRGQALGGTRNAGVGGRMEACAGAGPSEAGEGGAGGRAPRVPGETEDEAGVLDVLFDEATIDSSSGEALARLAATIGLARGYAVCRCSFPADALPANPIELLRTCARDESGLLGGHRV